MREATGVLRLEETDGLLAAAPLRLGKRFFAGPERYFQQRGAPCAASGFPREAYDAWIAGGLPVGSPQQVIDAIMRRVELLGIDRFMGQIDAGNLPWAMTRDSLELYMTEVVPVVKRETAYPRQERRSDCDCACQLGPGCIEPDPEQAAQPQSSALIA